MWVDFPILNPYSSHMALPMWVQRGTMLQIPHESLMGCPYRTHINTHLLPMWVLYLLLAGTGLTGDLYYLCITMLTYGYWYTFTSGQMNLCSIGKHK